MKKSLKAFCILFICSLQLVVKSQDLIVKINGDSILAKISEVGLNAVSYKKASMPYGPNFIIDKAEIFLIKYNGGEIEYFNKASSATVTNTTAPATPTASATTASSTSANTNTTSNAGDQQTSSKNKIEFIDDKYTINGQAAKRKDVNRYLEKSKNPAILIGLKATKLTTTAQKIVKITSIPTTIIGGFTTLFTLVEGYQLVQRGRATRQTFANIGLSFVATLALPITNKILKKKSDKMYDKLIDMYNLTN